jgi:hypothetical protein
MFNKLPFGRYFIRMKAFCLEINVHSKKLEILPQFQSEVLAAQYFLDVTNKLLVSTPLMLKVENIPGITRDRFIEFINDNITKPEFSTLSVTQFWSCTLIEYN